MTLTEVSRMLQHLHNIAESLKRIEETLAAPAQEHRDKEAINEFKKNWVYQGGQFKGMISPIISQPSPNETHLGIHDGTDGARIMADSGD